MKIIVGLGNPGLRYKKTRHNIGFLVLDVLSKRHRIAIKKKSFNGIYGVGKMEGREVMLFKPLTYMNLSGSAVKGVCEAMLEDRRDLIVVNDDVSLSFGSMRLREKGSSGGHNGLKSIIETIGDEFMRLKIGINPADKVVGDMSSFVLSNFHGEEKKKLADILERAADCVEIWISKGARPAMDIFN
ncbi:MAG: aminoacyl-tRNA hydrolase [Candidatus Omnitrophica bacterium]|nr:aminoacyl-tRNA hydrolase [Candidatus Omnitrophota bacterium]